MKRLVLLIILVITLTFAAACRDQQAATPESPEATEASAEMPVEDAAAEVTEVPATATAEPTAEPIAESATAEPETEAAAEPTAVLPGESTLPEELTTQLDAFLQSQVYSEGGSPKGAAPGLVLLVDTPDGTYLKAAGFSSLEDSTPMQVDDRLEIGSNSKSFTIAVLMQLQEEGLLSFDDMLSDWLPELAAQIPNGDQITLRQLAAHTSGIWDYADPIIGAAAENPEQLETGYTPQELVQYAIENGSPDFDPGASWKYSNTGYILLGMIAEKASGQILGDLYQERIFDPLGLESAVLIEGVPQEGEITTQGYYWLEDGTRLNTTNWNASQGWSAGAIAMTAADLVTYAQALAAGELFADPASLEQMLAFNETAMALGGAPFGLGLIDFGQGFWGHEGQTAGFQSLWYTNPDEEMTVAGLTNSAAYSGFGFLNIINILQGRGLQPFQPATMMPVAEQAPTVFASHWQWMQVQQAGALLDIPTEIQLILTKDGSATLDSADCGQVPGTFTTSPQGAIAFELDSSAVTCDGSTYFGQLIEGLGLAESWRFENGSLLITLSGEEGELYFSPPGASGGGAQAAAEACALAEQTFPRPEPDYSGKLARDLAPFADFLAAYTTDDGAVSAMPISGKSIPELQALMESGELTSVDLVAYYLLRIQQYDIDKLNAVLEINPDVLEIARAMDEERASGKVRTAMHGIPVLLKDNIATGDQLHTAAGSAAMLDWDPDRDAFLVNQLREAGAVILGKANLSEWANYMDPCMPNGFSTNGGQTQNPYGPFDPYGSSSGSAVAVAADLATVSVGTETQGSIIIPAAINSVVALKPSKGLISTDYVIPLLPFQDVPGPMGRTVTDVAVLLSAMTGVDENDFTTANTAELAGVNFTQYLNAETAAQVSVGVPIWNQEALDAFYAENGITDEAQQEELAGLFASSAAQQETLRDTLIAAGVNVVEVRANEMMLLAPADTESLLQFGFKQAINDFLASLGEDAPVDSLEAIIAFNNEDLANRAPYGQDYLEASQNTPITAEEFASLQQLENGRARNALDILFENYGIDVLVSDGTQLYATAGYPALTVPSGYSETGQPLSTIFIGPWLSEPDLLAVGYAYEQATQARVAPDLEAMMQLIEQMN